MEEIEEDFVWNEDDIQEVIELDDESEQPELAEEMDGLAVEEDMLEGAIGPDRDDAVTVFSEHGKSVFSVSLHPTTASVVVSGGEDDRAFVWNMEDGKVLFVCEGHKDSVTCTSFSHDGKLVATGDMSGMVKAWRVADGKEIWSFECGDLEWLHWHPLAHVLLAGTSAGELWMWKIPSGDCKTFQSHGVPATCGKVIHDGKRVAVGYADGSVKVWDLKSASLVAHVSGQDGHQDGVTCIDCNDDGSLLISGSSGGSVKLISTSNGKIVGSLLRKAAKQPTNDESFDNRLTDGSVGAEAVGFCHVLSVAAIGSLDGELAIWDVPSQRVRHSCEHKRGIAQLQWHASQPLVYTCSLDGTVNLWDGRTGELQTQWLGHSDHILAMAVSKDGSVIVTGSDDGTARVFRHQQESSSTKSVDVT